MVPVQTALGCHVLVLNKHYMAIRVVDVKRAISLLVRDLAEVIDLDGGQYCNYDFSSWLDVSEFKQEFEPESHDWIRTVKISVAVPRIVRLLFYDHLPKRQVTLNRRNIYARDHNSCQYCGKRYPPSELSLDHVIPKSKGGGATWENLVCACLKCNVKKGSRPLKETNLRLIAPPVKPNRSPVLNLNLGDGRYSSWKQFLDHAYWSVELK